MSTLEAASGFIMISINVNFCKEGFNPSYIMIESYYRDSSSDKNMIKESRYGEKVMVESRYSENVMAETAIREDEAGILSCLLPGETTDDKSNGNALFVI